MNPAERAEVLRQAINAIKAATHTLIEADLFGAADEVARTVMNLERQYEVFVVLEHSVVEASRL